jgi:uncharacterized flavoprotein (TIGR03862 family)
MTHTASIIGAGPAGLMAAELLATHGVQVTLYERQASVARKFLMAGRGGLNVTHSEPLPRFLARYTNAAPWLTPYIEAFPPEAVGAWCKGLGIETFTGTSGRVFPVEMKASPLLRAWLNRLNGLGVQFITRATWTGWDQSGALTFQGSSPTRPDVTILAVGGASWPRLGSDGSWATLLPGTELAPFKPANCGFLYNWSAHFAARFAGQPLKRITATIGPHTLPGELMITASGIEGGAIYALSAPLRDAIEQSGTALLQLDLRPDLTREALAAKLGGSESLSTRLRKAGLAPVAVGLVQELRHRGNETPLADLIKALPLHLTATAGLARAISTAGGIKRSELTPDLMLRARPGIFAAGEMLDWDAPTGGYLLQACFALGRAAGQGALKFLAGL